MIFRPCPLTRRAVTLLLLGAAGSISFAGSGMAKRTGSELGLIDFTACRAARHIFRCALVPPFSDLFMANDVDGATGDVVAERDYFDDCLVYDGASYGDVVYLGTTPCIGNDLMALMTADSTDPQPGEVFVYALRYSHFATLTPYGWSSSRLPRTASNGDCNP